MAATESPTAQLLAERYAPMIYRAAVRQLGGQGKDAEDVTQAVFLIAMRKERENKLPKEQKMAGWLLTITHYAVRESKRRDRTPPSALYASSFRWL